MRGLFAVGLVLAGCSAPAAAEIASTRADGFVVRHETVVTADPKQAWLALISPDGWWRSEHTWSGDAANLSLMPKAGECFCERIPEVDEPGRFTLEGSVEHMRVVQANPEQALRMRGGLGPLQSEPATGILTITLTKLDEGTRIVWEYNVGGPMRYEIPVISKAVDGVIGLQAAALADVLGRVDAPAPAPAPVRVPLRGAGPDNAGKVSTGKVPAGKVPADGADPAPPPPPGPQRLRVEDVFGEGGD